MVVLRGFPGFSYKNDQKLWSFVIRVVKNSGGWSTPDRSRTCDTRFRKPLLYPLSYGGNLLLKSTTNLRLSQFIGEAGKTH